MVYGGVSLAVYINGVCREFENAVRSHGIYKSIKATERDIVVYIIWELLPEELTEFF